MITLNFKQSPIELPPSGQDIIVISSNNPAFGLEHWNCVAYNSEGEEFSNILPFDSICHPNKRRDIMVSLDNGQDTSLENFLQMKFLWILKTDYDDIHEFVFA
jgi:hypothetical protein